MTGEFKKFVVNGQDYTFPRAMSVADFVDEYESVLNITEDQASRETDENGNEYIVFTTRSASKGM